MTDQLMIQLPFADVKRELRAAWEATRVRLQPPCPSLYVALEGAHAALYQVYDRDYNQAQPVILLNLRLSADGQYSLLVVENSTHDRARALAILVEWIGVFKQNLPGLKPIMLYSEWLQRNTPALAAADKNSKSKPGRRPLTDDKWEERFKQVEAVLAFKKESKIESEKKACEEYETAYNVVMPYGTFRYWKEQGEKKGKQFAE